MRQRKSRTVRALLLGATISLVPVAAVAVDAHIASAHASNCHSQFNASNNTTSGYCYNVQTFGVDHWQGFQTCTNGGIQYGPVVYQPTQYSTTPRCYGTVTNSGVVYN